MSLRRRYLTVVEMNSENLLFLHIIFQSCTLSHDSRRASYVIKNICMFNEIKIRCHKQS